MENKKTAVFGIYTTVAAADLATDSLVKAGFSAADISALLPENLGSKADSRRKSHEGARGRDRRSWHRSRAGRSARGARGRRPVGDPKDLARS